MVPGSVQLRERVDRSILYPSTAFGRERMALAGGLCFLKGEMAV
jgi:hypothetical protein